jgi:hypothetical protein
MQIVVNRDFGPIRNGTIVTLGPNDTISTDNTVPPIGTVFGPLVDPLIAASARVGSALRNVVYDASGRISSYELGGILVTLTYDASWRIATVTEQGVTRTVYYNASGRISGFY